MTSVFFSSIHNIVETFLLKKITSRKGAISCKQTVTLFSYTLNGLTHLETSLETSLEVLLWKNKTVMPDQVIRKWELLGLGSY